MTAWLSHLDKFSRANAELTTPELRNFEISSDGINELFSMDVFAGHLAALEEHLEVSCDGLEATNDRLSDLIDFLKRTILEVQEVDAQAQIERERYEEEKTRLQQDYYHRRRGPTASEKREVIEEHGKEDAKADGKQEGENGEGEPSLDDILNKARNLREAKANQDPPPPFLGGGSASRSRKSEAPASKVGARPAPKKAPGKAPSTSTTRRPLHEAKSAPRRGTSAKLSVPNKRPNSSGSKPMPESPTRKSPASPSKKPATPPVNPDKVKKQSKSTERMPPSPPPALPPPPKDPEPGPLLKHLFRELGKKRQYPLTVDGELDEDAYVAMAACPSKETFMRRANLLSEAKGRATLPPSLIMALLEKQQEQEQEQEQEQPLEAADEKVYLLETIAAVRDDLMEVKQRYDRLWSLKLERLLASGDGSNMARASRLGSLQDSEKEELFRLWYRSRRLFEIYGDLRDRLDQVDPMEGSAGDSDPLEPSQAAQEEDEAHLDPAIRRVNKLYGDLIGSLPSRTPLAHHVLRPPRRKFGQKLHPHPHEAEINAFHDAVRSRAEFFVETILGSTQLRDLVQDMRQVCSQENTSRSAWVAVLKKYRLVYSMLVDRARTTSSVKFLNK